MICSDLGIKKLYIVNFYVSIDTVDIKSLYTKFLLVIKEFDSNPKRHRSVGSISSPW